MMDMDDDKEWTENDEIMDVEVMEDNLMMEDGLERCVWDLEVGTMETRKIVVPKKRSQGKITSYLSNLNVCEDVGSRTNVGGRWNGLGKATIKDDLVVDTVRKMIGPKLNTRMNKSYCKTNHFSIEHKRYFLQTRQS